MSERDFFTEPAEAATPIDDSEVEGLLPSWIATRGDLNAAEQANIVRARQALARRRRLGTAVVLDEQFVRALHRMMFGDVWRWAGTYRLTERNIGVDPWQVPAAVVGLMADAQVWIQGSEPMDHDEVAVTLHHRLVAIHPFPNGNGRHARELADLLLEALGRPRFTWGRGALAEPGEVRAMYIRALRAADRGDLAALRAFVRA